ncbi:ATP-binding protein [Pseudoxanthomonas sp. CAU 1598]|uniref:histidine kinase n=1 Tax=Pseudomarimonas arenosa TaxID=2774145 RepID=A0AAW3ZGP5_9GAMM|nr:ATP-binding protein [Pseudomarimonas arenosa]
MAGRLLALNALSLLLAISVGFVWFELSESRWSGLAFGLVVGLLLSTWLTRRALRPLRSLFRALQSLIDGYRNDDFSVGLHWQGNDELADLVAAHTRLGHTLREQRLELAQRELLLDSMVQHSPVAMLLAVQDGPVVFANLAARRLISDGRKLEGQALQRLLPRVRAELAEALQAGVDTLISLPGAGGEHEDEQFQLLIRQFRLNGRIHLLYSLRRLTPELRRQEVNTWKKVIRVMSHEMNNTLGPIRSVARSGQELLRRQDYARLNEVLDLIGERAEHLDRFLRGYAQFAKLPLPRLGWVRLEDLLEPLSNQFGCHLRLDAEARDAQVQIDQVQLEQALSNLIKNATEAGSPLDQVELGASAATHCWRIWVVDRGSGMGEEVMQRALMPFYSTKRSGTGLGLALVREIVEAHRGKLQLRQREGGGLEVEIELPRDPDAG